MISKLHPFHELSIVLKNEERVIEVKRQDSNLSLSWKGTSCKVIETKITYDEKRGSYIFLNGNVHQVQDPKKVFPELQQYCDH